MKMRTKNNTEMETEPEIDRMEITTKNKQMKME